ncbi:hypothetical protein HUU39_17270 [candidate division KSB1 bacterium]|nr:hypothetical protein [candidate division KSB1 bacterium]
MAIKLIRQDVQSLFDAYHERKSEYDSLRAAGNWAGAILSGGMVLELALKLVICKHLGVPRLPVAFQVHDLELLFYCSGHQQALNTNKILQRNFRVVLENWSLAQRYEGAKSQADADLLHQALFEISDGVVSFLTSYL